MHSIWAVARNTLAQTLRMKIAAVVLLLLVILLPLMSVVLDGDGTLLGKLQTFTSYGLGLISLLLCILTIAVSTFTLSNDIRRRHIFLVLTKPINRWQLILGKLLAVVLLNVVLLTLFGGILYACTCWVIPKYADAAPEETRRAEAEFFTSRIGIPAPLDEEWIEKTVQNRYKELAAAGEFPETWSYKQIMDELTGQAKMVAKRVDPAAERLWEFKGLQVANPDAPDTYVFVRYKYRTLPPVSEGKVLGLWTIGDLRPLLAGEKPEKPPYQLRSEDEVQTICEIAVPANAIAEDDYLAIAFYNHPNINNGVAIVVEDLEVLYQTDTFTENYIRAILMILVRLIFLAALGISLTTWLSFPVAIFVSISVFCVGLTNGFVMEAIDGLGITVGAIYSFTIKPIVWMLPQFDGDYNPNGYIVDGRTIRWMFLATTAAITIFVKALVLLLLGMLIFRRREVAKAVT